MPAGSPVTLVIPPVPTQGLPIDAATGIDLATQEFSWSAMGASGPYLFILSLNLGSRTIRIASLTDATTARLPPTADLGIGTIPSGTAGSWGVSAGGGAAKSLDALVAATNPYDAHLRDGQDVRVSSCSSRTFTTR